MAREIATGIYKKLARVGLFASDTKYTDDEAGIITEFKLWRFSNLCYRYANRQF